MHFDAHERGPIEPAPNTICRFVLEQIAVSGFETWWKAPCSSEIARGFAADVVLVNHCPKHLCALGGEHIGHAAIVAEFRRFMTEFTVTEPCLRTILADGFHIAATYSVVLRHIGTGRSGRIAGMAHVVIGSDLRIQRIENFFDTAALAEVGEMLENFAARSEAIDQMKRASLAAAHEKTVRAS